MKKIVNTLLFVVLLGLFGNAQNVIETNLQEIMNQRSEEMIDINIILKSQIETDELKDIATRHGDRDVKREVVIETLKQHNAKKQSEVLSILDAEKRNSNVSDINTHWIVNSINCKATPEVIYLLAEHPDVALIGYNEQRQAVGDVKVERATSVENVAAHVQKVDADKVWDMGYTGKDVVVAVLDTGTNFDHTDINSENLWDGGSEYPYHGYNFIEPNMMPYDDHGHGSHCAGIICGTGASGSATGVAPDATLMTLKIADNTGWTTMEYFTSGVEFAVENGADVLSISIGWQDPTVTESTTFRHMFNNTLELGVLSSIAAGNDGDEIYFFPVPQNINAPGNCPPAWIHPDQAANAGGVSGVISVGAVNNNNGVAEFSSRGPVTWQETEWADYPYNPGIGLIRPDICAPGVGIVSLSHTAYDGYIAFDGTSMAAPCVAGVIALMLEKDPDLAPSDLCRIIETTATKLSATKSNTTGSGLINALAAVNEGHDFPYLNFASCSPEVTLAGDNKELIIKLVNNGTVATTGNTDVTISTEDEYVTIVNGTISLEAMEPKETASGTFKINIDANAPIGHVIDFTFIATCSNGDEVYNFTDDFSIEINSLPYIRYQSCSPAIISSETSEIAISMFNNGNVATTGNATVTLSSTDQYMTVIDDEAVYGPMQPNENEAQTFSITTSSVTPKGHIFDMQLTTVLEDNFSMQDVTYDFEDMTLSGWTNIDANNDGYIWMNCNTLLGAGYGRESKYCLFSQSYDNNGNGGLGLAIEPDNYLVSPMKIHVEEDTEISFWAAAQDGNYPAEHFGVAVSTTGNTSANDFTTIAEWTMTAKSGHVANEGTRKGDSRVQGSWYKYTVNFSEYVGEDIWVALRHFDCYDQYFLAIDDITISNINMPTTWVEHFSLKYDNPTPMVKLDSFTPDILLNGDNEISVTMINEGAAATTDDIRVLLSTDDQFVTITENDITYPSLGIGETATKTYTVNVDPSAPNGQVVNFNIEVLPVNKEENSVSFNFNDDMNGWTLINANNDDHTWYHSSIYDDHDIVPIPSHSGGGHIMSETYCNNTGLPIVPDDYVVSPIMIEATENTTVSLWACTQDEDFPAEHFGVAVSSKGNTSATDFTTIAEWTLTGKSGYGQRTRNSEGTRYGQWSQYTVDLSEYAGQKLWIAVRHFNCTNQFCINIDDIEINNYITVYDWESSFSMTISNDNVAPKNLIATSINESTIELTWTGLDNADSYNIYRDGEYLTNVEETTYTDIELDENTEYCYSVAGVIEGEETLHSNTACAITETIFECMAPSNITYNIEEGGYGFMYLITIEWDAVPGAASYSIYVNNNYLTVQTDTKFVTGVNEGGEYKYNIITNCGENGSSELSEDILIVCGSGEETCLAPTNLQAKVEEDVAGYNYVFKVTLTWDKVAHADSYNVYIDDELFGEDVFTNSYTVGIDEEGTYVFEVTANCANGESDMSQPLSVKVEHIGINEYESKLELFPNPVDNKLYISSDVNIEEINIFNIMGVQIYNEQFTMKDEKYAIDVDNLQSGIYIIEIKTNNNSIIKRFIKK